MIYRVSITSKSKSKHKYTVYNYIIFTYLIQNTFACLNTIDKTFHWLQKF